jgi:transcription termination factor NusB
MVCRTGDMKHISLSHLQVVTKAIIKLNMVFIIQLKEIPVAVQR